jgi:bacillithiol system protein YtxJ
MSESPDAFRPLEDRSDWQAVLDQSDEGPVVVFKHSSICPTSARAQDEMKALSDAGDLPVYRLVVQESREISDAIAEEFGIQHESPQVIVVKEGAPVFDASHRRVKADVVRDAVASNGTAA